MSECPTSPEDFFYDAEESPLAQHNLVAHTETEHAPREPRGGTPDIVKCASLRRQPSDDSGPKASTSLRETGFLPEQRTTNDGQRLVLKNTADAFTGKKFTAVEMPCPVAPPRRKPKKKKLESSLNSGVSATSAATSSDIPHVHVTRCYDSDGASGQERPEGAEGMASGVPCRATSSEQLSRLESRRVDCGKSDNQAVDVVPPHTSTDAIAPINTLHPLTETNLTRHDNQRGSQDRHRRASSMESDRTSLSSDVTTFEGAEAMPPVDPQASSYIERSPSPLTSVDKVFRKHQEAGRRSGHPDVSSMTGAGLRFEDLDISATRRGESIYDDLPDQSETLKSVYVDAIEFPEAFVQYGLRHSSSLSSAGAAGHVSSHVTTPLVSTNTHVTFSPTPVSSGAQSGPHLNKPDSDDESARIFDDRTRNRRSMNPLTMQILRRTGTFEQFTESHSDSDGGSQVSRLSKRSSSSGRRQRTGLFAKIRSKAKETLRGDETDDSDSTDVEPPREGIYRIKHSRRHKGPYVLQDTHMLQDLSGEHHGAVWVAKFSPCGRLLASGGEDKVIRVWVLKAYFAKFNALRAGYRASLGMLGKSGSSSSSAIDDEALDCATEERSPFCPRPFSTYTGHSSQVLDLSWSRNFFLLSSSMDKTVRLWHVSAEECLCCFQHSDFVTSISFHPTDDRYFLSGSLDGKVRLWNITEKKVALWNEVDGSIKMITAVCFCKRGRLVVAGTYDGRCFFYSPSRQMQYSTQIKVQSSRGRNRKGHKISGLESTRAGDKLLVTTNDSRVRLYDLKDLTLLCKYKGVVNKEGQIRASFSSTGHYVLCGSENGAVYLWQTFYEYGKLRNTKNSAWESIVVHSAPTTTCVFSSNPAIVLLPVVQDNKSEDGVSFDSRSGLDAEVFAAGDFEGCFKLFTTVKPAS